MIACDKCNRRLEDCECEPGFPYLAFDPIKIYGEIMLTFDQYCVHASIIGDAKIRFELWVGNVLDNRTEAEWLDLWRRYQNITPRRALVGD